jgi:hypothetical protein
MAPYTKPLTKSRPGAGQLKESSHSVTASVQLERKGLRSISSDWKPEPFGRHPISESRTMKSNLIALLRVTYLDGQLRAPRGFKRRSTAAAAPVTQKPLSGQRSGAPLLTSSEETKKLIEFAQFLGARSGL